MKFFRAPALALVSLLAPLAHAVPVAYVFSDTVALYTLNGVPNPPTSATLPFNQFSIVFYTDTANFTATNYPNPRDTRFTSTFYNDPVGTGVLFLQNSPVATITDPLELRFDPFADFFRLTDLATGFIVQTGKIGGFGNGSGDATGLLDASGTNLSNTNFGVNTSAGFFGGSYGSLSLSTELNPVVSLPPTSTAPEPSSILLLSTGAMGLAATLRKRLS